MPLMRTKQHVLYSLAATAAVALGLLALPASGAEPESPKGGQDPALFLSIWGLEGEAAKSCSSETDVRGFLETVGIAVGDSEREKRFSDVVESLATEKPQCFLAAANSMQPRTLKIMIERFLAKPRQRSSKEIEKSLAGYWSSGSYAKIRAIYFESRR